MPRPLLLLLLPLATAAAGCGADNRPSTPRQPVQLTLSAPLDGATTREASVQVSGVVVPAAARVLVVGERASVSEGRFSAAVALREGTNVIDIGASAPGRRATWRALRVSRHSTIVMPAVVGREEGAARGALENLGLNVTVNNDDDIIDAFRGGPELVCASRPDGGAQVKPGSNVELVVSKTC